MMGTGTFAEPTFDAILKHFPGEVVGLVTQPDRDVGRRSGSSRQTGVGMANIAKAHSIPVLQPASINRDGLAELAALNPDLCVVAAYGQIFKADVLRIPSLGFINVHASLLPKYRGAAPVVHAILNGEAETGVTIFRITTGVDTGEMLAKESLSIGVQETAGELEARLAVIGADLIVDVVQRMKAGSVVGEKQNPEQATKAPKITKEMGLIDWTQSAERILRHIRAMQPWPTAYTHFFRQGQVQHRLLLIRASPSSHDGSRYPGSLDSSPTEPLIVRTGDQSLAVEVLQIAGKKPVTAAEFVRGHSIQADTWLGPLPKPKPLP